MGRQKWSCSTLVVGQKVHLLLAEAGWSDNQHDGYDLPNIEHGIVPTTIGGGIDDIYDGVGVIGALLLPPEGMGAGGAHCRENGGPWPILDTQNPK